MLFVCVFFGFVCACRRSRGSCDLFFFSCRPRGVGWVHGTRVSGYSAVNAPTARCSRLPAFETVQRVLTSTISKYSTPLLNQERVHALLL